MKVSCEREKLNNLVQTALRAVSTRVTMPILSGVLLSAHDDTLSVCGTDLELTIKASTDANVEAEGSVVASGRLIGEIVKNLPEGEIRLESGEKNLTVSSDPGTFSIKIMSPEDFPAVAEWEGNEAFSVGSKEFQTAVSQTSRASSNDDKRPVLTGSLVEKNAKDGKIRIVATDSYRLAWAEFEARGNLAAWEDCIVPTKSLVEVARVAAGHGGDIQAKIYERQAMFKIGDMTIRSMLIEGQFPQYKQLVPKGEKTVVVGSKGDLIAAVKRALILGHNLIVSIGGGAMKIKAETPDVGESQETVPVDVQGAEMEVGFNGFYLLDGISAVDGDEVEIGLDDPQKPGIIRGPKETSYTYILMPMRLR